MPHPDVTFSTLLRQWREGNAEAGENLIRLVYDHLHWLAQHYLSQESHAQSLQPTDLVNEAYLRLFGAAVIEWEDQAHFFVIAARQMRRLLIDRARTTQFLNRKRRTDQASLSQMAQLFHEPDLNLLALDESLAWLEEIAPRAARVVELRYFAGLTETQAAQALGISVPTLKRDWKFARLWLYEQLEAKAAAPVGQASC